MAARDPERVRQAIDGDPAAFGDLVVQYSPLVYSVLTSVLGQAEAADDLAHDTYCKAWRALSGLRDPRQFPSWLARIARRTALDWVRAETARTRAERTLEEEGWAPSAPPAPDEAAHRHEVDDALRQALDALDEPARQLLLLRHVEGCSYRDIAGFLDLPTVSVYQRLRRAERRLAGGVLGVLRHRGTARARRQALRAGVLAALGLPASTRAGTLPLPALRPYWHLVHWKLAGLGLALSAALHLSGLITLAPRDEPGGLPLLDSLSTPPPAGRLSGPVPAPLDELAPPWRQTVDPPEVTAPDPAPVTPTPPDPVPQRVAWLDSVPGRTAPPPLEVGAPRPLSPPSPGVRAPATRILFRPVRLDGAGAYAGDGSFLQDLAAFLPDCCGLDARIADVASSLDDPAVLAVPIHFLFQGAGQPSGTGDAFLRLEPRQLALVAHYLHSGGLLYLEGDMPFLHRALSLLRQAVPEKARLVPVNRDHPLYHVPFDLSDGLPGEGRSSQRDSLWTRQWRLPPEALLADGLGHGPWAIQHRGRLLVVLSALPLFGDWQADRFTTRSRELDRVRLLGTVGAPPIKLPRLRAAANLVTYALDGPIGVATHGAAEDGP